MFFLNKLHELLMPWLINCPTNIMLTDLQLDSRNIVKGNLFMAIKGCKTDGKLYIDHAIANGAIAVLSELSDSNLIVKQVEMIKSIPIIHFNQLRKYVSSISGRFYGQPSLFVNLVGVTGTNGKTTISHLLANWVNLIKESSAVVGTLGSGSINNIQQVSLCTTYSAVDTQRMLARFVQSQIKFIAMEVSSHGLDQYRVDALYFNVAIFSNLSDDHLDYHENMKKYELAKWRLFSELYVENYVINIDDDVGLRWLLNLPEKSVAVTMRNNLPKFWAGKWICLIAVNYYLFGTDIIFNSSWGKGIICSQLLGTFNVSNILLALGALLVIGYPLEELLRASSRLVPICGRMEAFRSCNQRPTIIIDYAHTPDALKKVLSFVRQLCYGRLWCVFGCGGDRDRHKRVLMGLIAEQYSDYVIITNDNPRTENPECIINDIISGIRHSKKIKIILDRSDAIQIAMFTACPEDFILVLGKGHEKYQIIGNDYIKYSDQDVVKRFLKNNM